MEINWNNIKIGYVPYSADLSQPGDRRRFPFFAARNNIRYELASIKKNYDVILITGSSDLSKWLRYKRRHPDTKFLFEMVDSFVFSSDLFTTLFKGIGRFIRKRETHLYLNYQKLINEWIRNADVVICSNNELIKEVLKYNPIAFLSPDYLESEYNHIKESYEIEGKMKLIWEGLPSVLPHFLYYRDMLSRVNSFCELHIITKSSYPLFGNVVYRPVSKLLKKLPIKTHFHEWDINTHAQILANCDCAVIPLNRRNSFAWAKPANKLVSFWFTGLPTVVSNTPAYVEIIDKSGAGIYCNSTDEWVAALKKIRYMTNDERKQMARKNFDFVLENFCDVTLDNVWREIFKSLVY